MANSDELDDPLTHSLRSHFGQSFNLTKFSADRYSTPYANCTLCGRRITESPVELEVGNGYVRINSIEGMEPGQDYLQWEWICEECFSKFQSVSNWKVLEGDVDPVSYEKFQKYKEAVLARRETDDPVPSGRYELHVRWCPEEIVGIARLRGVALTVDEGSKILWRNRRRLMAAMDSSAFDVVSTLIERDAKNPRRS